MPRIYVASLSDYNNGVLYGKWIDATQDADAMLEEVTEMLRGSKFPNVLVDCPACDGIDAEDLEACATCNKSGKVPSAEEYAIHDYEGFEGIKLGEYESFDTVATLAEMLEEHGAALALFYNNESGNDLDSLEDRFQEAYRGRFDSVEGYAEQFIGDCYGVELQELPSIISDHIDWQGIARDLEVSGDIWSERIGGDVYVFDNNVWAP